MQALRALLKLQHADHRAIAFSTESPQAEMQEIVCRLGTTTEDRDHKSASPSRPHVEGWRSATYGEVDRQVGLAALVNVNGEWGQELREKCRT